MSEAEVLEPVPVTKDPALVNGDNAPELPPPDAEMQNGINEPVMDVSNGHEHKMDDNIIDRGEIPVNGDCNGDGEGRDNEDLMGDELPPPPEVIPELPPPPVCDVQEQDLLMSDNTEPEPIADETAAIAPEIVVGGGGDQIDENQEEDINEAPVQRMEHEVSDEELVSYGGLKEELDVEIQNNQENEDVEQAEGQLVDVGETEQTHSEHVPEIVETLVPTEDVSEDTGEEGLPEPAEPVAESEPEQVYEEESVPVSEPLAETVPAVITEAESVIEQEPEPFQEPEQVETVQEQKPEDVPEHEVQPVQAEVQQEIVDTPTEETEAVVEQSQLGYAEPDIIVDNKPAEEEPQQADVPPPPPPPLVEETPPPPPPLDESVQLKRVSGGSTPTKQSPCKELPSPVVEAAPEVDVAVASEPEPVREPEPVLEPAPSPAAVVMLPAEQSTPEPLVINPPQAHQEQENLSSPASPTISEPALSEGGSDTQAVSSPQVSQKINKKNFKSKIKFGVDLVEAALKQLHFLMAANKHPTLYEEWLFKKAIRRYEAFWLPLAAEHKKESLAAPLDIEWVWHCHILAPLTYETDCKNLVGLVIEHKLMSEKDRTKSLEKSRKYWTAKYPSEPFEIELLFKEKVVVEVQEEVVAEGAGAVEAETVAKDTEAKNDQNGGSPPEAPEATQPEVAQQTPEATQPEVEQQAPVATQEGESSEGTQEAVPDAKQEGATEPSAETNTQPEPAVVPTPAPAAPEPKELVVPEEGYEQRISYNIFSAISRQRVFSYQVSLPHFHDKLYLKSAVKRYQKFLFLKHQNPTEMLVPYYDIDLIWHAHQLHPSVYKHDITKVLGQMLQHDDSVNNRASGSKLSRANQKTSDLWKALFDESFVSFGGMYRGDPPVLCERMVQIQPEDTYRFSTKKATIHLDKVQVEGLPEEVNKYNVKLVYGASEKEEDGPVIKQLKGNKKKIEFENVKKGLAHFVFDTKEYDIIKFNMTQHYGFACTGHNEEIGAQIFNLMPVVEGIPMNQSEVTTVADAVTIDIDEEHNLKALFTATIEPPKQGPTMLFLKNGNYETRFCIMPEQIVQMWGPIPLPRLPSGKDNHCLVASHKFVSHTGEVTFTCRLIHSLSLLMSAVQVFFHNKMAAVGHLIGSDQIPLPSQLSDSKKVFSLNPADGQRAILIKNQTGDWGMLRGHWTGFRKHQPSIAATKGKKAKKEVPWCPGTLAVSFYKCTTGAWQHLNLPYLQDSYKFTIQDAIVDLKTGTIQINSESNEVAENLTLGFSVALLHVLCQPRYTPPPPPEPIPVTVEAPPPPVETKIEEKPKEGEEPVAHQGEEGEGEAVAPVPADEGEALTPTPTGEGEPITSAPPAEGEPATTDVTPVKAAEPQPEPPATPKTPKSPAKSEPPTPSKKVKEVPPIPTCELSLVIAAGYNVDTATNDNITKLHGITACAGCSSGMDAGIGHIGTVAAEAEGVETAEVADNVEADGMEGADEGGDGADMEAQNGGEMDMMDMDAMGDVGDAGAAGCAGF